MTPTVPSELRTPARLLFLLPTGTVYDIADVARRAAFAFVEGAGKGWGKAELDAWFSGPYASAVAAAAGATRVLVTTPAPRTADPPGRIEAEILRVHTRLLDLVDALASSWESAKDARSMLYSARIASVRDRFGATGYAPVEVDGPTDLWGAVASLLVADYLTRPRDYQSILVCGSCGVVSFDWDPTHHDSCDAVPAESGIFVQGDPSTCVTEPGGLRRPSGRLEQRVALRLEQLARGWR